MVEAITHKTQKIKFWNNKSTWDFNWARLSYMVTKRKAKRDRWKKTFLNILIWKSLKQAAVKLNIQLGWIIRIGETIKIYRYRAYGVKQRKKKLCKIKTPKILRDNCVSPQNKLFDKNN